MADEQREVEIVDELEVRDVFRVRGMIRFGGYADGVPLGLLPSNTQDLGLVIERVNELIKRVAGIQGNDVPLLPPPRDGNE